VADLSGAVKIAPSDRVGQEAFAIIREAMSKKAVVGIARVVRGASAFSCWSRSDGNQVRSESAAFEDIASTRISSAARLQSGECFSLPSAQRPIRAFVAQHRFWPLAG
jgi:hypothetical protein